MAENEFQDLFEDSELLQEWPLIQGPDTEIPRGSLKDMNESSRLIQGSPSGYINSLQGDNNEDSLQRRVISWEDDFNTLSPSHLECNVPSCLLENPIDRHTQQLAFDDAAPLSDENSQPQQQIVVTKIETIIASILDGLVNGEPVTIPIKRRSQSSEVKKEPARRSRFSYPGSAAREAWQFTIVLRILELIHQALVDNVVTTLRDIYYKDPKLFLSQRIVDCCVNDIAFTFDVQRSALNVTAAAKGLVAGSLIITRPNGAISDATLEPDGMLIPALGETDMIHLPNISWVLVLEKEATFRSLASSRFYHGTLSNGIIITAKGYPDISTRSFLHRLSAQHPVLPIHALLDFDPDGLAILSTYKHGSHSLRHENPFLITPTLHWIGVGAEDIVSSSYEVVLDGVMLLSLRDRRRARGMLACSEEREWKRDVQVMLVLGLKAEMQVLDRREGGLERWLREKLGHW